MGTVLKYKPDYAVAPGATLKELLEEKGLSQSELAMRAEISEKTISQIVNGVAPISYETAEKLELVLGTPANYWNRRELAYREALARIEATERLEENLSWLEEIPVVLLKSRKYIPNHAQKSLLVRETLKFFGVSSVDAWNAAWGIPAIQFCQQAIHKPRPGRLATWLRLGELQAAELKPQAFNADEFRRTLSEIRSLTLIPAKRWKEELSNRCVAAGVAVVFTGEIAATDVNSATRWLTKDKALIQLGQKLTANDQLWTTFFHAAGHLLLHGKKQVFVEFGKNRDTVEEREANAFARDSLIPAAFSQRLPLLKTKELIVEFANTIGIAPNIVLEQLKHEKLLQSGLFNDIKKKLSWSK